MSGPPIKIVFQEDCNDKMLPFGFDLKPTCLKYVATSEDIADMKEFLKECVLVGIDTERKPSSYNAKGETHIINPTAVIQIAGRNASHDEFVYIVDLQVITANTEATFELDDALGCSFGNDGCIKIGHGLERDFRELHDSFPDMKCFVKLNSVVETTSFVKRLDGEICTMVSLKYLVQRYLNCNLVKTQQLSNWGLRPLTLQQIHYAACDALVLVRLFDVMCFEAEELLRNVDGEDGESAAVFDVESVYSSVDCSVKSISKKRSNNRLSSASLASVSEPDQTTAAMVNQYWKGWSSPAARDWFSEQIQATLEADKSKRAREENGASPCSSDGDDFLSLPPLPKGRGSHMHFSEENSSAPTPTEGVLAGPSSGVSVVSRSSQDEDTDDDDEEESVNSGGCTKSIISRGSPIKKNKKRRKVKQ